MPATRPDVVGDYLDHARAAVEADLGAFLDRVRADDAYGDYVADYPSRPGKGFRPSVGFASTEAHGGSDLDACGTVMVALELLHNAFLAHDDFEDGSLMRRGEPSLHIRYGDAAAVHAGDSLVVLALRRLDALGPVIGWQRTAAIRSLFEEALSDTVEGQGLEFRAYRRSLSELDERNYFDIVTRKTAVYTVQFPLMAGALLGSWQSGIEPEWEPLAEYGLMVGLLFQVVDDIKNYHDTISGKDADDDLQEGKLTPMLLLGWKLASPAQRNELDDFYRADRAERCAAWCARTKLLLDELGVPEAADRVAAGLAASASLATETAFGALVLYRRADSILRSSRNGSRPSPLLADPTASTVRLELLVLQSLEAGSAGDDLVDLRLFPILSVADPGLGVVCLPRFRFGCFLFDQFQDILSALGGRESRGKS